MSPHLLAAIAGEVEFNAVRSRGPGGQNVNKVSSAAFLLWDVQRSNYLNDEQKQLVGQKLQHSINKEGMLYLRSDEFRDLERNKERCLEKLGALLQMAFHRPKKRKPTGPTRASKIKKREGKTRRSEVKKNRRKLW